MKKFIHLLTFLFILFSNGIKAQSISNMFFSQNYWQPNRSPFTGQLQTYWTDIQNSGAQYMRVGGISYDANSGTGHVWTAAELASGTSCIIAELRSYGIEPILQIPIDISQSIATNASNAATLVNAVNNTYSRNIVYWEIGNEPNGQYSSASGSVDYETNAAIRDYIQQVSTAMKGVSSGIKIIGPSLSYYDYASYHQFLGGIYDITGSGINGYYVDYIDFHTYPFQNECYWQTGTFNCSGTTAVTRSDVVNYLTATSQYKDILADIISYIPAGRAGTLKICVTEANLSYEQNTSDKTATGIGPASFLAGQYWTELMSISMEKNVEFVSFWSAVEGTSGNSYLTDIGYISAETSAKRSSYWHYQLLASKFNGTYFPATYYAGSDYKVLACTTSTSKIRLIIMNQGLQSPRGLDSGTEQFKVNFNGSNPSGTTPKEFSFSMGTSVTYSGGGSGLLSGEFPCTIQRETTMYLEFDKTTGQLTDSKVYSLQDALRTNDIGPNSYGGGSAPAISSISDYGNHISNNVYSTININTGSSSSVTTEKVFQFTNGTTINGPFRIDAGIRMSILPTTEMTCY